MRSPSYPQPRWLADTKGQNWFYVKQDQLHPCQGSPARPTARGPDAPWTIREVQWKTDKVYVVLWSTFG